MIFYGSIQSCTHFRFWAGPIVILVAMKAMPLWVREKTVNGVELTVTFIGHLFFLVSLGSIDPERLAVASCLYCRFLTFSNLSLIN